MSFTLLPHKKTFIVALLSMMLCVCNLHAQLFRDLILILDPAEQERTETETLTRLFKAAVQEGAAPIMASSNLVNNAKVTFEDGWIVATSSLMTTVIPPAYVEKIRKEAQNLDIAETIGDVTLCGFNFDRITMKKGLSTEEKTVESITKRLTPEIAGHEYTWNIYLMGHGNYVSEVDETAKQATEKTELKETKEATLPQIPSAEKIIRFLNKKTKKEDAVIAGLKINNFKKLLIFLNGQNVTLLRQERRTLIKNLKMLKRHDAELTNDEIRTLKKIVAQSWQAIVTNKLKTFEKTPMAHAQRKKEMLAANFKTQLDATIKETQKKIDLSAQQQAYSPTVKTGIFCYTTCYAGGFNRYLIEQTLRDLSFQGYVLSIGIDNLTIIPFTVLENPSFSHFFEQAKRLLDPQWIVTDNSEAKDTVSTNDHFSAIANTVGGNEWHNNLYAFWYVPGRDTFETYTTAHNVFVLGNVTAKKHVIEKKPINATNYPVVLVQPMRIMPMLEIDWSSALIPIHPHEVEDLHTIQYFNAINIVPPANNTISQANFFAHLLKFKSIFSEMFLIKTLKCPIPVLKSFPATAWPTDNAKELSIAQDDLLQEYFNKYIFLENVIIIGRLPGRLHITCSYAHKNYHALIAISDEEMQQRSPNDRPVFFNFKNISEKIKFEPCPDYDVAKEFTHLYRFIQHRDLARFGKVTNDDIQHDNALYKTMWAEEEAEEKKESATTAT